MCTFMVDSSVIRILHGKHPAEIIDPFIDHIGNPVATFGDIQIQTSCIVRVMLCNSKYGIV